MVPTFRVGKADIRPGHAVADADDTKLTSCCCSTSDTSTTTTTTSTSTSTTSTTTSTASTSTSAAPEGVQRGDILSKKQCCISSSCHTGILAAFDVASNRRDKEWQGLMCIQHWSPIRPPL